MGTIAAEFKGLPMADLIGGPLAAACDAEVRLANATAQFIQLVGFQPPPSANPTANPPIPAPGPDDVGPIRNVSFTFTRPVQLPANPNATPPTPATTSTETVSLNVPFLAMVKVPALSIDTVDIVFDMEVKSSSSSKSDLDESLSAKVDATAKWGAVRVAVSIQGTVSSHKENTRSTDNSAKYHVEVRASDKGPSETFSRLLDILQSAIVPVPVLLPPPAKSP
jgi:Protein of unknown function (DUF2589)